MIYDLREKGQKRILRIFHKKKEKASVFSFYLFRVTFRVTFYYILT